MQSVYFIWFDYTLVINGNPINDCITKLSYTFSVSHCSPFQISWSLNSLKRKAEYKFNVNRQMRIAVLRGGQIVTLRYYELPMHILPV